MDEYYDRPIGQGERLDEEEVNKISKSILYFWHSFSESQRVYYIQAGILILAQIADSATTSAALGLSPNVQELNAFTANIYNDGGFTGLAAFKIFAVGLLFCIIEYRRRKSEGTRMTDFNLNTLRVVNTIFAVVSIHNLYYLISHFLQQ
jgi:hypothetical protein